MDIDGPTGGYNLTAAFASAALAVTAIAKGCATPAARPFANTRDGFRR
jgi:hypothetical protein